MPTYKVTAPDGRVVRVTGDTPPTDAELTKIFADLPPPEQAAPPPRPTNAPVGATWQGATGIGPDMGGRRGIFGTVLPGGQDPELHRGDVTLGGLPPELAAVSGLAVGRAMAAPAATLAGRAVAGAKAIAAQAGPVVKYEATRHGLQALGVPATIAIPLAMVVSGYRRGGKVTTAATDATEAGTTVEPMSDAAYEAAAGHPRGAFPAPVEPVPVPLSQAVNAVQKSAATAKVKLTAEEFATATKLAKQGHASEEVLQGITALRQLKASPSFKNLPSSDEVIKDVAVRNATGTWGAGPVTEAPAPKTGNPFR